MVQFSKFNLLQNGLYISNWTKMHTLFLVRFFIVSCEFHNRQKKRAKREKQRGELQIFFFLYVLQITKSTPCVWQFLVFQKGRSHKIKKRKIRNKKLFFFLFFLLLRKIERGEGRRCLCILRLIICDIKFYNDSRISAKERRKECGYESFFFFLVFLVFSSFVFSICRKAVLSACFFPLPPLFP